MLATRMLGFLLIILSAVSSCASETTYQKGTITNSVKHNLTVAINGHFIAKIANGVALTFQYELGEKKYQIEAKYDSGMIAYSKEFTGWQLYKMGGIIYIIPPKGM